MSKALYAERFLLGVATLAAEVTNPNASGGTPASAGSLWSRQTPTGGAQLFQSVDGGATSWTIENLANLTIYNVKAYGAIGDGVTDDTIAINAAVTAARAASGGGIYFPPGNFRVTRPASNLGSIFLNAAHDLVFFGDGPASQISMIGDAKFGDWYMFRTVGGTTRIKWHNVAFFMNITNPDPAQQNHFLNLSGNVSFPAGGTSHIDVTNCYFGSCVGDCVRNLGETGLEVTDVNVLYCDFNMISSRSAVEAQRSSDAINISFNFMTGSHDQQIDFEPTAGAGPINWMIVGNHFDCSSSVSIALTLSGAGNPGLGPNRRCQAAFNTFSNGGGIEGVKGLSNCDVIGNICTVDVANAGYGSAVIDLSQGVIGCSVLGNVAINQVTTNNRVGIRIQGDPVSLTAPATNNIIADNIATAQGTASLNAITCTDDDELIVSGNIVSVDTSVTNVSIGISCSAAQAAIDHIIYVGNMVIGLTSQLKAGLGLSCSGFNFHNASAIHNWVRFANEIVIFDRQTVEQFLDWRYAGGNNGIAIANAPIAIATNAGVTGEGSAGPGAQIAIVQVAAGPQGNVNAPVGSLCTNTVGGDATVLFVKETGAGVSGGNTGWVNQGPSELVFGAQDVTNAQATHFLAPGQGLAVAGIVEIQIAMPRAGTLRNLRVQCVAGTGPASNVTYTVNKNGVATAVALTMLNSATNASSATSATVAAGDLVSIKVAKSATPTTGQTFVLVTLELSS